MDNSVRDNMIIPVEGQLESDRVRGRKTKSTLREHQGHVAPHIRSFTDGHAIVQSNALFIQASTIGGIFIVGKSAVMVDIGVRGDIDGFVGCVERNAGASLERRGWGSADGRRTGQTRYPDDCECELGRYRGGDEEGEHDVSQVCGQVQRMDRFSVRHRRQSVAFSRFPLSFFSYEKVDVKFVILHETKNDDGIKVFFNDLWELYLKVRVHFLCLFRMFKGEFQTAMNPFHTAHTPIRSAVFDSRVRASAKKNL